MSTPTILPPSVDAWKQWAASDAARRGLGALAPVLDALAPATARLRATGWQAAPDAQPGPDAGRPVEGGPGEGGADGR